MGSCKVVSGVLQGSQGGLAKQSVVSCKMGSCKVVGGLLQGSQWGLAK